MSGFPEADKCPWIFTEPDTVNVLPELIEAVTPGLTIKAPNTLSVSNVQFALIKAASDAAGTYRPDQLRTSEKFELTTPVKIFKLLLYTTPMLLWIG